MANRRYARRRRNALFITAIFTTLVVAIIIIIIFSLANKGKNNITATATQAYDFSTVTPTDVPTDTDEPIATVDPLLTATPEGTSTVQPTPTATTSTTVNETRYAKISADSKLNVRETASTTANIVATLNYGETVTVTAQSGDWYKIKTSKDKVGYVKASYLVTTKLDVSTEMKKLWDKSGLYREGSTTTTFSQLTASYVSDYKISFKLSGTAGSATNSLAGTAYIIGGTATYTKDSSKVTFTLSGGKIVVAVTKITTPSGITYAGTYSTTKPSSTPTPTAVISTPLLNKGVLFTAAQETAFKSLTGANYATFVSRCQTFTNTTSTGDYKFNIFQSAANEKAVIKITADGAIWAALTNDAGKYTIVITNQTGAYPDDFKTAIGQ